MQVGAAEWGALGIRRTTHEQSLNPSPCLLAFTLLPALPPLLSPVAAIWSEEGRSVLL